MDDVFNGKKMLSVGHAGGDVYRRAYNDAVKKYIENEEKSANAAREKFMPPEKLKENPEYYRKKFIEMIGQPSLKPADDVPKYEIKSFGSDDFGDYSYVSVETFENMPFFGVLQIPKNHRRGEKLPVIIAQHGGGGMAESCSDMCGENNYSNFTKRILEKGIAVFAPQLMLWNFNTVKLDEKFPSVDIPFSRKEFDERLRLLGLSMTGLEVFCLRRCIDFIEDLEYIDSERIGMMGLSYGGYFSLYTAAVDLRIKAAYDAAAFNDRNFEHFYDWSYFNMHHTFHDAEVAGLVAPRPLFADVGKDDAVFGWKTAVSEAERAVKYYDIYGKTDNFSFNLWEGGHRFDIDGKNFERFLETVIKKGD